MESKGKMLNAVKYVGGTILTLGMLIFLAGFFESGYSVLTPVGIGTVFGAIFIFLMGVFFVATEEMHEKTYKGIEVEAPIPTEKGAPL
ncbi:hypothetical protein F9802_09070 [Bacillus aerolatus]|uniref:Uncharacterized protein n=1 Tax=Bacillus aerolatus TaxID=2653354 RepID=A0A6I1FLP6_9BACI|nr:hypothetical protein [Bacillus aerolatus]KAB7707149.1 hypothetical protein F9802_09070 [Bacillus aerolatus]